MDPPETEVKLPLDGNCEPEVHKPSEPEVNLQSENISEDEMNLPLEDISDPLSFQDNLENEGSDPLGESFEIKPEFVDANGLDLDNESDIQSDPRPKRRSRQTGVNYSEDMMDPDFDISDAFDHGEPKAKVAKNKKKASKIAEDPEDDSQWQISIRDKYCFLCEKKFDFIKVHYKAVHLGIKDHKCDHCNKSFAMKRTLLDHKVSAHGIARTRYKCNYCDMRFESNSQRCKHVNEVHKDKKVEKDFRCDICDMSFTRNHGLRRHMERIHDQAPPFEPIKMVLTDDNRLVNPVEKVLTADKKLIDPVGVETKSVSIKMEEPEVNDNDNNDDSMDPDYEMSDDNYDIDEDGAPMFKSESDNEQEQSGEEEDLEDIDYNPNDIDVKDNYCYICQKQFTRIRQHYKIVHLGLKEFQCHVCQKFFSQRGHLRGHIKTVHEGEKKFECDQCDLKFTTKASKLRHIRNMHEKIQGNLFNCDVCGVSFTLKSRLQAHMDANRHDGKKDFPCHMCDKIFTEQASLNIHIDVVHEGNLLVCEICDHTFTSPDGLRAHMRKGKHTKIKGDYNCFDCDRSFPTVGLLHQHAGSLHNDFDCKICGNEYDEKSELIDHMKDIHKNIKTRSKEKRRKPTKKKVKEEEEEEEPSMEMSDTDNLDNVDNADNADNVDNDNSFKEESASTEENDRNGHEETEENHDNTGSEQLNGAEDSYKLEFESNEHNDIDNQ